MVTSGLHMNVHAHSLTLEFAHSNTPPPKKNIHIKKKKLGMRQIVNTDNRPKWEGKDHPNISKITATYFLNHWLQNRFRNKNILISNN